MEHLQIAYGLLLIIIGFAALFIAGFWASKTRETDLRDFCIVYAWFALGIHWQALSQQLVPHHPPFRAERLLHIFDPGPGAGTGVRQLSIAQSLAAGEGTKQRATLFRRVALLIATGPFRQFATPAAILEP